MIAQRLDALRKLMKENGIDAYVIPSADAHQSEYVASYWKSREWISGFTGSAGLAVVTLDHANLWTDGRYYIQAEKQITGSEFELFKAGTPGVPTFIEWLADSMKPGTTVGFDGRTFSVTEIRQMIKLFKTKKIAVKADKDLIDILWADRPAIPKEPLFEHAVTFAGKNRTEKLSSLREYMRTKNTTHYIVTTLDDIAWLYNLRGHDMPSLPVFYAYTLIGLTTAKLYIDMDKITPEIASSLKKDGVEVYSYETIRSHLESLSATDIVGYDPDRLNCMLEQAIPAATERYEEYLHVILMKSPKNTVEIGNIRNCYIKDCVALEKFFYWLETHIGKEPITEISAEEKLLTFRKAQDLFIEPSFYPISAYRANAAMMHYRATLDDHAELKPEHFYLLDSGGHYLDGTTDITRTVALGPISEEEIKDFTLVLKSVINLSIINFVYGSTGTHLDVLARRPMWEHGMDYKCGTGHGVGMLGSVHEAPQRFVNNGINTFKLEEGMLITNEPGVYKAGKHGIRTENTLLVQKGDFTEYGGQFMNFETLTYCHIDTDAIDVALLTETERHWLNNYHEQVFSKISPFLSPEEKTWLKKKTKAV